MRIGCADERGRAGHSGRDPAAGARFWGSKALLSAVELGVFTELAKPGPHDGEALRERLGLHARSATDFFDALVALGMLEREDGRYANTPATDLFLDRAKPSYVGGMLEMANARLYRVLGVTDGGPAHRHAAERGQARRRTSSRRSTPIRRGSRSSRAR